MESLHREIKPRKKGEILVISFIITMEVICVVVIWYVLSKPRKVDAVPIPVAATTPAYTMTVEEQKEYDALAVEVDLIEKEADERTKAKMIRMLELSFGAGSLKPPSSSLPP